MRLSSGFRFTLRSMMIGVELWGVALAITTQSFIQSVFCGTIVFGLVTSLIAFWAIRDV